MSDNVVEVTDATFEAEVLESDTPVLVDFWAAWCAPCRMVAPVVESIADEYAGRLKVCKLNVDENRSSAAQYGVMSIPTLILFKDGAEVERFIGYMPKEALSSKLEATL